MKVVSIENVMNYETFICMYCNILYGFHFRLQPVCAKNNIGIFKKNPGKKLENTGILLVESHRHSVITKILDITKIDSCPISPY